MCVCVHACMSCACVEMRTNPRSWFSHPLCAILGFNLGLQARVQSPLAIAILPAFLSNLTPSSRKSGSSQPTIWRWMMSLLYFSFASNCFSNCLEMGDKIGQAREWEETAENSPMENIIWHQESRAGAPGFSRARTHWLQERLRRSSCLENYPSSVCLKLIPI